MSESDKAFAGSVPAIYDRILGPLWFVIQPVLTTLTFTLPAARLP